MTAAPHHFTAAQLARVLNVTPGAILLRLNGVAPSGIVRVRGQSTRAWAIAALPESLRLDLDRIATQRGLSSEQLFAPPPAPWQPPVPWHQIPAAFQELAETLSQALAPALAKQHQLSGPDYMALASIAYRQHFGNELATDKLRYILDRATRRDNGLAQFHRAELFLDDAAFHAPDSSPSTLHPPNAHAALDHYISALESKSAPTPKDRRYLLDAAFRHFEKHTAAMRKAQIRAFKKSLAEYLYRAVPALYQPRAGQRNDPLRAIRKLFDRSIGQWIDGGRTPESLQCRAGRCGRKLITCEPCDKIIRARAGALRGDHGQEGNVDLAIKLLLKEKRLCARCHARRSRFPLTTKERIRVTPNAVEIAARKGPDELRKIGPTHHTTWDTEPGDRFVIDDMTTNEITWDEVDGQILSGQAQLLYTEDEVSGHPLPFWLYFGAPNSLTIKKAILLVITKIGLPHIALLTERGVFANRMLAGEKRAAQKLIHFRELESTLSQFIQLGVFDTQPELEALRNSGELGLRDPAFGLTISQARSPQAKTVERSFYEFQKRASELPGFAGFNQRFEKSRIMQDFDRRVSTGKEHPGNQYLHISELRKRYEKICADIDDQPINGTRHRGLSPRQLWEPAIMRRPLRKLPPAMEAHLHTHRLPKIKVHPQGIKVSLDRFEDAFYFGEHTGPLVGRYVAIRIDYDAPGFIHIEHPDTGALLKVERSLTKRTRATPEEIAKAGDLRRAHIKGARGEAGNITPSIQSWITDDNRFSDADMQSGRVIGQATEQNRVEQTERRRELNSVRNLAEERGDDPDAIKNPARYKDSIQREAEIRARLAAKQTAPAEAL